MSQSRIPPELRYTRSHEWIKVEGDVATIGITDHAQSELTDIVFVDLPSPGKAAQAGASLLVLESVKTVADVYAPGSGTVLEVNAELKNHPELINQDPYGKGWIAKVRLSAPIPADRVMDAAAYGAFVESASH